MVPAAAHSLVPQVLGALDGYPLDEVDSQLARALDALSLESGPAALAAWRIADSTGRAVVVALVGDPATCRRLERLSEESPCVQTGRTRFRGLQLVAHATPTPGSGQLVVCLGAADRMLASLADPAELQLAVQALALVLRPSLTRTEVDAVSRAAMSLHSSLDRATVFTSICREAAKMLDADMAALYRQGVGRVTVEAVWGLNPGAVGYSMPEGHGLAGKVLRDSAPAWTEHDARDVLATTPNSPYAHARAGLAVPMLTSGRDDGVLAVGYERPFQFMRQRVERLQAFAELAASAFANADAYARAEHAARTDALTGCRNHAGFREVVEAHLARAKDSRVPVTIVLLDLNHFKAVNDTHGHPVGDELLCEVARSITAVVREDDAAARLGGDEFAIVLPGADEFAATAIAERVIAASTQAMRRLVASVQAGSVAGVATSQPGCDYQRLVTQADRALFFAKQNRTAGRCVRVSEVPPNFMAGEAGERRPLRR
jgi:diguanylate cyclase (GGDEF)-like protein